MYQKSIIVTPEFVDAGTIEYVTSETSPATNLQDRRPWRTWVAGVAGGNWRVVIDLGSSIEFDFVGLFYTNLGANSTAQVYVSNSWLDAATFFSGTTIGTSFGWVGGAGATAPEGVEYTHIWNYFGDVTPSSHTYRYVGLDITPSTYIFPKGYSGSNYVEAGRIVIDKAFRPPWHVEPGHSVSYGSSGFREELTAGNRRVVELGESPRDFNATIVDITEDDIIGDWLRVEQWAAKGRDVIMILDPDPSNLSVGNQLMGHGPMDPAPITHTGFGETTRVYNRRINIRGMR